MPDVEKGFANDSDDWRISNVQLLGRASVKRKFRSRVRPAEHCVANLARLRFRDFACFFGRTQAAF